MPVTFTPANIFQGPGNLWVGCTVPATGSRLLIDINGNPTQGAPRCVGGTEGAMSLSIGPKYEEEEIDQIPGAVDVVLTTETNEIDVTLKEITLQNLQAALANATYATGNDAGLPAGFQAYEEVAFGGLVAPAKSCIAVISQRRDAPGKFVVATLYNAYAQDPIATAFDRSKATVWKVKFRGLNIPSRPAGDMTGKIYRQI